MEVIIKLKGYKPRTVMLLTGEGIYAPPFSGKSFANDNVLFDTDEFNKPGIELNSSELNLLKEVKFITNRWYLEGIQVGFVLGLSLRRKFLTTSCASDASYRAGLVSGQELQRISEKVNYDLYIIEKPVTISRELVILPSATPFSLERYLKS